MGFVLHDPITKEQKILADISKFNKLVLDLALRVADLKKEAVKSVEFAEKKIAKAA